MSVRPTESVVVTGIGVIAGPHVGVDAVREAMGASTAATTLVEQGKGLHVPGASQRAVLCAGIDWPALVPPGVARRMSVPSRFAVAAARLARRDALLPADPEGERTAVVMSTAFGPVESSEQILDTVMTDGPQVASPFVFAESVANAAAGQVAIDTGSRGPNITVIQREAGSLTAVRRGVALVASGAADRVLAGVVDHASPVLHAVLGRFDALARPEADGAEVARPFDRDRSGFLLGEGACVVVLERESGARARGAPIRARVAGGGGAFDPTAPRVGWGHGDGPMADAIARSLDDAGVPVDAVPRIVSGASGAVDGDRLEGRVLRRLWGSRPLPTVLAPKAQFGQFGGGFLAASLLAVAGGRFAPTPGFRTEDPDVAVCPYEGGALGAAARVLSLTLASGGSAAWLLLELL
ncbi:MAG: beta-ketoacyl synthase N-terminal-like domain-containing protein [Vicinamibacterales bacterium]